MYYAEEILISVVMSNKYMFEMQSSHLLKSHLGVKTLT